MDLARLELGLSLALHSFTSLLLVVLSLHLLKLAGEALDLILVLIDLGLVHVELGGHSLHLASLLLQILLRTLDFCCRLCFGFRTASGSGLLPSDCD